MHTFATPHPLSVAVDVPAGRVRLVAGPRTDTTVELRPTDPARRRDTAAAERTDVELRDGVLRITTPTRHELLGPSGQVDVTVHLPAGSDVRVDGSAQTQAVGRLGDVTVTGSYGAVTLDEVATARVTAAAGDVVVGRLAGPAEIATTKGDVRVAEAHGGRVVLSTQMGDIDVSAAAGVAATLDAGTALGRVSDALRTDGTPLLALTATTSLGDITARSL